jgi:hypothetical protein
MTPALARTPDQVRADLHEEMRWFSAAAKEAEKRWVKVAYTVREIRDGQYWREWGFETFDQWLAEDCASCRRTIYSLLTVVDRLGALPPAEMEKIGRSKLYELARVAKDKPDDLPALLAQVQAEPEMSVEAVKDAVARSLYGLHHGNGKLVRLEFVVPEEDEETVQQALLVARVLSGIADDSPAANGLLLACIASDFLSGAEQSEILSEIEEAQDG